MRKITILSLCVLFLFNCTIQKDIYQELSNSIFTENYEIVRLYKKGEQLSFYKDLSITDRDSIYYRVYYNGKTDFIYKTMKIKEFILLDLDKKKKDTINLPKRYIEYLHDNHFKTAYYPNAKELYYKELLIEEELLPLTKKDSIEIIDYGKVDLEESKRMLKQKNVRKWVYATITMPEETLKVKYVQGGNAAFFGTDSLYQKGVLFFFTGSNHEVNRAYSGLYVIRPKRDSVK